ncbi:hypothetical protein HK099_006438, partial [Clydaea vesicula]
MCSIWYSCCFTRNITSVRSTLNDLKSPVTSNIPKEYLDSKGNFGSSGNYGNKEKIHKQVEENFKQTHPGQIPDEQDDLFYYFSLHDYNHDGHLDGHELRSAFYLPE